MIEKLTDYLLKRRLKKSKISVDILADKPSDDFKRVLNTLRENKVMVETREDGLMNGQKLNHSNYEIYFYE